MTAPAKNSHGNLFKRPTFSKATLLAFALIFATIGGYAIYRSFAASLTSIYIAQSAVGANSGADCADAHAASFFNSSANWGTSSTQIGPGTTVHLCGTITTNLVFQASGTSGNPITLFFETGAKISMPVCPGRGTGCLDTAGKSFLTIDGGSNGIIESTANGTGLANQDSGVYGIEANNCAGCEIKNLTIQNLYQRTNNSDEVIDGSENQGINYSGSNISIDHDSLHDIGWALVSEDNTTDSNVRIYDNNIYHIDHGWATGGSVAGGNIGPIYFYDNNVHDFANWDSPDDSYHHDGIHCFTGGGAGAHINGLYIYDNTFGGQTGNNMTAQIFLEGQSGPGTTPCADASSNIYIFNNVLSVSSGVPDGIITFGSIGNMTVENNTITGPDSTDPDSVCVAYSATTTSLNNAIGGCNQLASGNLPGTLDHNAYADCSGSYNCWFLGGADTASFSTYQSQTGKDTDSVANLTAAVGSNAAGVGENLTSSCTGNLVPLCTDINGNLRPTTGPWDAGAYETSSGGGSSTPGDLNSDGQVNAADLSILLSYWNTNNSVADINHDGIVNILDLSILLSHWGTTGG